MLGVRRENAIAFPAPQLQCILDYNVLHEVSDYHPTLIRFVKLRRVDDPEVVSFSFNISTLMKWRQGGN